MRVLSILGAAALSLSAWLAIGAPADAVGNFCSVSGSTATSIGNYNPFTGSSFNQVQVNFNLTRYVSGARVTRRVDFYLVQPAGSSAGYAVRFQNSNVLYTLPATHALSLTNPPPGTVYVDYSADFRAPNTVSFPLVVSIPTSQNLVAGDPITFDIVYICDGGGGLLGVSSPTTQARAITIKINVVSALQASYAGPALAFGEVGALTDTQALTRSVTGAVRVASTGPYTVKLSSLNNYRMTYPGGTVGVTAQSIRYSARFLGQTKDLAAPTFATVACIRAGTGGVNLPITVTLKEGGTTKIPSPSYADTLTVTVTPLAVPYGGSTSSCPSL